MRKQRSTFPSQSNQRFVTRPVPPRTVPNSKGGWSRHGRYGAR